MFRGISNEEISSWRVFWVTGSDWHSKSSVLHLQIICQLQSLGFHMVSDLHSGTAYLTDSALGCICVP